MKKMLMFLLAITVMFTVGWSPPPALAHGNLIKAMPSIDAPDLVTADLAVADLLAVSLSPPGSLFAGVAMAENKSPNAAAVALGSPLLAVIRPPGIETIRSQYLRFESGALSFKPTASAGLRVTPHVVIGIHAPRIAG